jgi:hypothetical protein
MGAWTTGSWTTSRRLANYASQSRDTTGPALQESRDGHIPSIAQRRQAFCQAVLQNEKTSRIQLGHGPEDELNRNARAALAREAIGCALHGIGYLRVTRRRVNPPSEPSFRDHCLRATNTTVWECSPWVVG